MPEASEPIVFVVCGAGGVGKGTLVAGLVERDSTLHLSRSWTTRARRSGEPPNAYVYVTEAEFRERVEDDGFYEWAEFFDHLYGTPTPVVPAGNDLLLEIDVQGAQAVRQRDSKAVIVLLLPPDREEQRRRMKSRGDDEGDIERRLEASIHEEELARGLADAVVLNGGLEEAISEVESIIHVARETRSAK